jgi:hypothetical protein
MLCEKIMTTVETRSALLVPQNIKQVATPKTQDNIGKTNNYYTNCGMINHNVKTCQKKE